MIPRLHKLAVLAGLALLAILFTAPAFLPGKVLLPLDLVATWPPWQQPDQIAEVHNPLISDVVDYIYPVKAFVADEVRRGKLPLWNPYVLGGYPLTYNTQAGLFYPLSIFYYLLPAVTAVDLTIIVQLFAGALFMFAYLRELKLHPLAAFAGSVVFAFNGMMVVWLEWQVVHAALAWMPLQLFWVERQASAVADRDMARCVKLAVFAGLAFAVPWLGGHWNWTLYGSMTVFVYWLWRILPILWRLRRKIGIRAVGGFSGAAILTFIIGVGASLVQVLPAFNYLRQGHRQALAWSESLQNGLMDRAVVALVPDFFGTPLQGNWYGRVNYNETAFYLGLLPWLLLILAFARRNNGPLAFFKTWGVLGLLWALGTPAYGVLYVLPVFNGLLPSRALMIVTLCMAVLSAAGLDYLLQHGHYRRLWVAIAWALMPLIVWGYWLVYRPPFDVIENDLGWFLVTWVLSGSLMLMSKRLPPVVAGSLITGWLIVDLFVSGYGYNTVSDVADLYPSTETADFLQQDAALYRIATLPQGVAFPPNTNLAVRLASISGYEPAILQRWVAYLQAAEGGQPIYYERKLMPLQGLDSPLLDALNVTYIVTITDWFAEQPQTGLAQTEINTWIPLSEKAVYQNISLPDAGFYRLDVWLQTNETADGTVTARIFTADGGLELANAGMPVRASPTATLYTFNFAAFPSEWGRDFQIAIGYSGSGLVTLGAKSVDSLAEESATIGSNWALTLYYLPRPNLVHESGKTRIYRNEGAMARVYAVSQALMADSGEMALALVEQHAAELASIVVLELEGKVSPPLSLPEADNQVSVVQYDLNEVVLQAEMKEPGFVVLADSYYPGWRAWVNGEETAVYRANSVVRAIYVPAGSHEIVFRFQPLDFYGGLFVSSLTGLLVVILLIRFRPRKIWV